MILKPPPASPAARKLGLDLLPPEIIHLIFGALSLRDVRQFRLVNRKISAIGACHALPELVWYMHRDEIEVMRMIAAHDTYNRHVRSLVYVCEVLPTRLWSFDQYKTILARHFQRLQAQELLHRSSKRRQKYRLHARDYRDVADLKAALDNTKTLKAQYQSYKALHAAQRDILEKRTDFEVLRTSIANFPNLREVTLSSNEAFVADHAIRSPFRRGPCPKTESSLHPNGVRQLDSLIQALDAAGTKLDTLLCGSLSYTFFEQPLYNAERMRNVCCHLRRFEIVLAPDNLGGGPDRAACRELMRNGAFRRLLGSMPLLESLAIEFEIRHEEVHEENESALGPIRLQDIASSTQMWPNLEELRLHAVDTDREELMDLLVRHKESLMKVYLKDICFQNTSWLIFLPALKTKLDTPVMTDLLISGIIIGEPEPDLEDADGLGTLSELGLPEYWDLGDPEDGTYLPELCLAEHLCDYLLRTDVTECPLNAENMMSLPE